MPQNRRETHGASAIQRNENQPKKCYYKKIHGFQEESDSLIFFSSLFCFNQYRFLQNLTFLFLCFCEKRIFFLFSYNDGRWKGVIIEHSLLLSVFTLMASTCRRLGLVRIGVQQLSQGIGAVFDLKFPNVSLFVHKGSFSKVYR